MVRAGRAEGKELSPKLYKHVNGTGTEGVCGEDEFVSKLSAKGLRSRY
jgi:hypothetical protein